MSIIVSAFDEGQLTALFEDNFTPEQRKEMRAANGRLNSLYKGAALEAWLQFLPKLTTIRAAALQASGANSTSTAVIRKSFDTS